MYIDAKIKVTNLEEARRVVRGFKLMGCHDDEIKAVVYGNWTDGKDPIHASRGCPVLAFRCSKGVQQVRVMVDEEECCIWPTPTGDLATDPHIVITVLVNRKTA